MSKINKTTVGMKLIKVIGSFFIMGMFLIPSNVKATHIVGGELTYRCLANWTFEVTLTVRRDCEFGSSEAQFDDPASVGIYDSNGELLWWLGQGGQLSIPFNADDTLSTEFVPGCDFLGEGVCVHTSTYIDTITLPFRPGGYILAYSRCCRNETLTNITDPLETGATFVVPITNKASIECNNSPTFDVAPDLYICANEELVADMSATDLDGDSLVYGLYVPYDGASPENPQPQPPRGKLFDEVNFQTGFSIDNFMGGLPLVIDPQTGIVTATPNLVGQFTIGVTVDEYRNGQLIGRINRDFQYNVRECIQGPEASFTTASNPICDGLEVEFTNTSLETDSFQWFFDFPNTGSSFSSNEENPVFTFPADGFYTVKLIATRSTDSCFDEVEQVIGVFDSQLMSDFNTDFIANRCLEDSIDITLVSSSIEPNPDFDIETYLWTLSGEGYDASGTGERFRITVPGLDSISVTLLVTSETGCTSEITQTINSNENGLTASFDADVEVLSCDTDSIEITIMSTSSSAVDEVTIESYEWMIEDGNFAASGFGTEFTLTVPRKDSLSIFHMIEGSNGCTASISSFIDTEPINDEDVEFLGDTILVCPGDSTFLLAKPNSDLIYTWTPEEGLIFMEGDTNKTNPQFVFTGDQTMTVFSVLASDGICSRDGGDVVLKLIEDLEDVELAFDIIPMCGTTTVCFTNNSLPPDDNYKFDFGSEGGTIDSMGDMICYTYPDFGLFQVSLTFMGGCADTSLMRNVIVAPDVELEVEADSLTYCAGDELTLNVNTADDGTVVEWYDEDNKLIGEETTITYLPEGDELLTVIGYNAGACFDTTMIQLIEYQFDFDLNIPEVVCVGDDALILAIDNTESNLTYVWRPEGSIIGSNEGAEITVNIEEDTQFTLTVSNVDNGCSVDTSFSVVVSTVSAEIEADPAEVFQCNPTDIGVLNDDPDFSYEWSTGETTPSFTTDTLLETTSFSVTVTDENGCTAVASISINVLLPECDDTDVFLPTAFTPNGDNMNDILKVESNFVKRLNLDIYTRWGELVFSTNQVGAGWDGTFNGTELAPDVYAFKLSATCSNDAVFTKVGNVTLIR